MAGGGVVDVVEAEAAVETAGTNHDEVAPCLAAYAAGTLDERRCQEVRAHLADGCSVCLEELFRRPVGLERPSPHPEPVSANGESHGLTIGVLLALIVATGLALGLLVRERHLRTTTVGETLARVGEAARLEAELRDRLLVAKAVLRNQRRVADAEQAVLARGAEEAELEARSLRERLHDGHRRVAELEAELVGGRLAGDMIASEGLELRALRPAAPFQSVTGHVLWRPADGEMVVYAFGLPGVPPDVSYEARAIVDYGRVLSTRLRRRADGRAFGYLVLPKDARTVYAVEVRRRADARRFLVADAAR